MQRSWPLFYWGRGIPFVSPLLTSALAVAATTADFTFDRERLLPTDVTEPSHL